MKISCKLLPVLLLLFCSACERTPKPETTIQLASDGVFSAALSKNFALLSRTEGAAELWKLKPKSLLHTWQHTETNNGIVNVAISGNEQYAVTAERDSLAWWRISDGALLNVWSLPGIQSLSLSVDGQFALIGLNDKAVYYALAYGRTIYAFAHDNTVLATDLSSDGQFALTGSEDKSAKLWDLSDGTLKYTWPHQNQLSIVAISPDNKYALTNAALSNVNLWRLKSGKHFRTIGPDLVTLSAAKFSTNSKYLATGRTSQRIDLWDMRTGNLMKYWRPKKEDNWRPTAATILSLAFVNNDKKLISVSTNGYLQRWTW